jgi:hypothetical protein
MHRYVCPPPLLHTLCALALVLAWVLGVTSGAPVIGDAAAQTPTMATPSNASTPSASATAAAPGQDAGITPSVAPTAKGLVQRLFISGHSLTDPPLPQHLVSLAAGQGDVLQWNMQSIPGSPIQLRTVGNGPGMDGYKQGTNRDGQNMNVLQEWANPVTVQGGLYDTLLVAEQHGVLGALTWHQPIRTLSGIHDRFLDSNPLGKTWYYEAWLALDNKDDPKRWIAYEREASKVWHCIAAKSNARLARMGRTDRIQVMPSTLALTYLVDRAVAGKVPGLSAPATRTTLDRIFRDDVHLTPLGSYYIASVVYAVLWGRSPEGAAAPTGVDPVLAKTLQSEAWAFATTHRATARLEPSMLECREHLRAGFIHQHWAYVRDTVWKPEHGRFGAYRRYLQQWFMSHLTVRRRGAANPFNDDRPTP